MLAAIAALMLLILAMFLFFIYSARYTRFEATNEGLGIRGTLYGRRFSWQQLQLDGARIVNLRDERDLQPTFRTNGVGLPSYQAGWFRTRSAGRALLFLTRRERVLAVPTTDGYTLLLSPADPVGLLAALRQHAVGTEGG